QLPGLPATLQVVGGATEETIMDKIEEAASMTAFVIVDLEGLASLMVSHAISMSDLVVIPVQGSQFDASQAARQIGLIKRTEKRGGRAIPYTVLITRTNPAIMPH
ncbi:ParA family protein, partial [Escherichia coli]|nr:ParA family protein [Escherichia coli]